ncbi:MAG: DUF4386 family protein [Vicinamibacterales bacterium]
MHRATPAGRGVGLLLIVQLAGLIVPFVLLRPVTGAPVEILAHAAPSEGLIGVALGLLLANGLLTIGISLATFDVFRRASAAAARWVLVAAVLMVATQALDDVQVLSLVALSRQAVGAEAPDTILALAVTTAAARRWTHLTAILAIDGWILAFYVALFRGTAVPRAVLAFGTLTALLHLAGIPVTAGLFAVVDKVLLDPLPFANF